MTDFKYFKDLIPQVCWNNTEGKQILSKAEMITVLISVATLDRNVYMYIHVHLTLTDISF